MSLAWNKENISVPNKMRTYDLPYTRRALSIHFELLRTHEERGHILDLQFFWTLHVHKSFFFSPILAFRKHQFFRTLQNYQFLY